MKEIKIKKELEEIKKGLLSLNNSMQLLLYALIGDEGDDSGKLSIDNVQPLKKFNSYLG